ncbi:hypothetical protein PCE1_001585 [Barthelona sp. PCE]
MDLENLSNEELERYLNDLKREEARMREILKTERNLGNADLEGVIDVQPYAVEERRFDPTLLSLGIINTRSARRRKRKRKKGKKDEDEPTTMFQPFSFDGRKDYHVFSRRSLDEYVKEKKEEEEKLRSHTFKAKKIPKSTTEPRFQRIMEKQKQRRDFVLENSKRISKENEKPFTFYERDIEKKNDRLLKSQKHEQEELNRSMELAVSYKARDMPEFPEPEDNTEERQMIKAARMEQLKRISRLPKRMQEGLEIDRKRRDRLIKEYEEHFAEVCTFRPMVNHKLPDYATNQEQFEKSLQAARKNKKTIKAKPFELRTAGIGFDTKQRIIEDIKNDGLHLVENRWPYKSTRAPVKPTPMPKYGKVDMEKIENRTTRLRKAKLQKEMEEKQKMLSQEKLAARERKTRLRKMAKKIAPLLHSGPDFKKRAEETKKEYKQRIRDMTLRYQSSVQSMYDRVNEERKTLFERHDDEVQRRKLEKEKKMQKRRKKSKKVKKNKPSTVTREKLDSELENYKKKLMDELDDSIDLSINTHHSIDTPDTPLIKTLQ